MMLDRRALLIALGATAGCATTQAVPAAPTPEPGLIDELRPLSRFRGAWRGEGHGEPGQSTVARAYASVLEGRFIEERNVSTYAPQPANPNGETHHHVSYWSFDKARRRFVLRQFHQEGFVNTYVSTTPDFVSGVLVLESEAIENIPAGFRARETYRFASENAFEEVFEIAPPGQDFALYSRNLLVRG